VLYPLPSVISVFGSVGADMGDDRLTPDIPLGPFEGMLILAYAATRAGRLHARPDCSRLRADQVSELRVPLCVASIKRMCAECARWGRWAPPSSTLGMYLEAVSVYGLAYQLDSYAGPDPYDSVAVEEIESAAALLRRGEYPPGDGADDADEDSGNDEWDAFEAARVLRDSQIVPQWCSAVESLMDAAGKVVRYPWLGPWAGKRLDLKSQYAETRRRQAALLLKAGALAGASGAHRMPVPELPVDDPAFAVLGSSRDAAMALRMLWREWQHQVSHGWLDPHEYDHLTYKLDERTGNKRKGREELHQRAHLLLDNWADAAAAAGNEHSAARFITATIGPAARNRDGSHQPLAALLTKWELGVLIMFTVAADWATRTFLLKVPLTVAERMLAEHSILSCASCASDGNDEAAYKDLLVTARQTRLAEASHSAFVPGVLDDTPISQRGAVTLNEVRALREALDECRQVFVVCSVTGGVEILPLATVEERCKSGWTGILVAEAGDLPVSLFASHLGVQTTADASEGDNDAPASVWDDRHLPAEHADFGEHLGYAAGDRKLSWAHHRRDGIRVLERNFRILTLARGVHDLRTLDFESDSGVRATPQDVWYALLLVGDQLDLRPFRPRTGDGNWQSGLGLPLSALADLQIYTTNADPRIAGKGHSPFCQHVRERGVHRGDFLLTLGELMYRTDLDWCANCGGYAIRRLSDKQVAYYRVAHRLLDMDQALTRELDRQPASKEVDLASADAAFSDISQWLHGGQQRIQAGDIWRVQDVVRELRSKADQLARYRRDGWPGTGSVIPLKPKR
jgi:hypothetical protein